MKHLYLVLIVLLLLTTACGPQKTENELSNPNKSIFSTEPKIDDVRKVWEWKSQDKNQENIEDITVIQICQNTRKDYIATNVYFDINLYAIDGSILKTENEDISIGSGSSWPIILTIHNDTGSRSKKAEVIVTGVEWELHNSETDKQVLDIPQDPFIDNTNKTIELQITNNSDYILTNAQVTYLFLINNDVPIGIATSVEEDEIAYGQSKTISTDLVPFFWDWVNADQNLKNPDNKITAKYWVTYDSYFDERVTISGEKVLEINK